MATVTSPRSEQLSAERRFYSRMALFLATLSPGVILHAALFTLWMLVFVAQTQLVAARRTDIHMKLGKASMLLAVLIVPMMYLIAVWQVERANQPPFTDPLNWTAIPLAGIPPYVVLVWTGWERRRQAQWHKRAMLGAAIAVVAGPAIGRLPIAPPTLVGFAFQMLLGLALFMPQMLWDRRSTGRIHPATWLGFGVVAASVVISLALVGTGTWAPIARQLPGI